MFTITHPSIHTALDDNLPQLPPHTQARAPCTHPLNLSNNSDESKHTTSSSNSISITNTTNTTPNTNSITHNNIQNDICNGHNRNIPISSHIRNPFSSNMASNNNNNITEDIYASPPHKTCIKPTDTLPIFDENERWTNTNFFSPGHEEIIGAWQTMFPLQDTNSLNSIDNIHTPGTPYKKSRPTPLSIPHPNDINIHTHTGLTADFHDIHINNNINNNNYIRDCVSAPAHVPIHNYNHDQSLALPNLHESTMDNINTNIYMQQNYDLNTGENNLFPNHSYISESQNISSLNYSDSIIPNTNFSKVYPTRIALPIVPSVYQNINQTYWQKHKQNPSIYKFKNSYNPYFQIPNSAPAIPNTYYTFINNGKTSIYPTHTNSNNNRPQSSSIVIPKLRNNKNKNKNTKPKGNVNNNNNNNIKICNPFKSPTPPIIDSLSNNNNNNNSNRNLIHNNNSVFSVFQPNSNIVFQPNSNNNNNNNNIVKRKRGRPRKYKIENERISNGNILSTPSPKKRKICKRSADRKNLEFVQYLKGDGTGPEMQIEDLSPQKNKNGCIGPNAKGFQRGGLRHNKHKNNNNKNNENVLRIIGGKDKSYKKPPNDHRAYNRIRIWKDKLGRQFYDCICNARKPVQDLNKIKSHVLGHDKIVWICDICGREFFNNHLQLNAHMKTHKKREIKANEQPIIK